MVFQHYHYQSNNMGSLWRILNNEEEQHNDDVSSLQQKHQGFVFSVPEPQSPVDDSDIAIHTLHALADLHHIKKERTFDSLSSSPSSSSSSTKSEPKWETYANSNNNNNNNNSNTNNNSNNNNNNNLSNCSRRDYKKKQLVIRPELMQMKQAKAAVKLGIPPSTFSKRWRESLPDRKWPYRVHKKVEKSIQMLKVLQNKGHDVTGDLKRLMTQRELNLKPAIITMFEDVNENFELDTTPSSSSISADSPSSTTPLSSSSPLSSPLTPSSPAAQVPHDEEAESSASGEEAEMNDEDYVHSPVSVPKRRKLSRSDDE